MDVKIKTGDLLYPRVHIREGSHFVGYVLDESDTIVDAQVISVDDFPLIALDSEVRFCRSKFDSPHYVRCVATVNGNVLCILSEYLEWDVEVVCSL